MRNKEKEKKSDYNNHSLIVINLTQCISTVYLYIALDKFSLSTHTHTHTHRRRQIKLFIWSCLAAVCEGWVHAYFSCPEGDTSLNQHDNIYWRNQVAVLNFQYFHWQVLFPGTEYSFNSSLVKKAVYEWSSISLKLNNNKKRLTDCQR